MLRREGGGAPGPDTLPVPSRPYSDRFCSSSSCCLLCLHTGHLRQQRRVGDARTAGPTSPSRAAGVQPRRLHLKILPLHVNLSSQNQIDSEIIRATYPSRKFMEVTKSQAHPLGVLYRFRGGVSSARSWAGGPPAGAETSCNARRGPSRALAPFA